MYTTHGGTNLITVDVLRELSRSIWFGVALFFLLGGIFQIITYIRGSRRSPVRTVYLPFIFFGFALFILAISSGIIALHAGAFFEFSISRLAVLTLIGLSGTLFTVGALTIGGYREYYGVPIIIFLGLIISVVYFPFISGYNIAILFLSLSLSLVAVPLFVFLYLAYVTKRFAPLAYGLAIFALFYSLIFYFIPIIPYLTEAAISMSAALLLSGSAFSRIRSKVSGITYSFAFLAILFVASVFSAMSDILSFSTQTVILDWGTTGFLSLIVAGYLGGRYFEKPSKPTFYLAAFFYFMGILSLLSLLLEILPFLPLNIDTTFIIFLQNTSYLIAGAFLVLTAMTLIRNERLTSFLLVYLTFSITVLYFLGGSPPGWLSTFIFASVILLYGFPLIVFAILVMMYAGRGGIAYYRAVTLFIGTLFFVLSYFFGILYVYSPWPVRLPVSGIYASILPFILRLIAMASFALGITGVSLRRLKMRKA